MGREEVRTHRRDFGLTAPPCQRLAEPKSCALHRFHRIPPREILDQMRSEISRACGDVEELTPVGRSHILATPRGEFTEKKKKHTQSFFFFRCHAKGQEIRVGNHQSGGKGEKP